VDSSGSVFVQVQCWTVVSLDAPATTTCKISNRQGEILQVVSKDKNRFCENQSAMRIDSQMCVDKGEVPQPCAWQGPSLFVGRGPRGTLPKELPVYPYSVVTLRFTFDVPPPFTHSSIHSCNHSLSDTLLYTLHSTLYTLHSFRHFHSFFPSIHSFHSIITSPNHALRILSQDPLNPPLSRALRQFSDHLSQRLALDRSAFVDTYLHLSTQPLSTHAFLKHRSLTVNPTARVCLSLSCQPLVTTPSYVLCTRLNNRICRSFVLAFVSVRSFNSTLESPSQL
jgi:hypothetical protein